MDVIHQDRILIFVPMYNCESQIRRVIAQFSSALGFAAEIAIVCVDNRSTDSTLASAKSALESCPVVEKYLILNDGNYGLGGSHKVALEFAQARGFDTLIVLHGDDQGSIDDIWPYVRDGRHRGLDALLGARFMKGATLKGYSPLRTWANVGFNLLFSLIAGRRLYDLGSGLNLFRVAAFNDGFHRRYADNLTFNYYLILGLADRRMRFEFFPINWREDDQVSNAKLFRQGIQMLQMLWLRIRSPQRFHETEHRVRPPAAYTATLVSSWPQVGDAGAP